MRSGSQCSKYSSEEIITSHVAQRKGRFSDIIYIVRGGIAKGREVLYMIIGTLKGSHSLFNGGCNKYAPPYFRAGPKTLRTTVHVGFTQLHAEGTIQAPSGNSAEQAEIS